IRENPFTSFSQLPYGETFFKNATGRCSNGLLMIDYIALSAGIPLLGPYLNKNVSFTHDYGVNFAVAGSTALPVETLAAQNVFSPVTNSSLTRQLNWMSTHFNETCYNTEDCMNRLHNSLFMVGEIGGNDYNYALFQGKTTDEVKKMVPQVVQAIKDAAKRVIGYGATQIVVPGNFPIGCLPIYLTGFQTNETSAYDNFHCLKDLNNLSTYHNEQLQRAIEELKKENSNTTIIYGDYYNAYMWVLGHASSLGFDIKSIQKACCGTGGDYNFNLTKMCGASGVPVCSNPYAYLSWDGVHSTQKTYLHMARWLIRDIYSKLKCKA
ncbi:acetylajmalan esterase-like, partial [Carica papaya]|uniref:acetylajmalan esterase-like n=1 Tax=Carica papaya TaxID=3649 RepID=UPI000B8CC456